VLGNKIRNLSKIIKFNNNISNPLSSKFIHLKPKKSTGANFNFPVYKHNKRYFHHFSDNSAVSNVVTSIMMLGILLTILAMIFTVYIPIWAKTGESTHMEEVENSFLDLKSTIDKQITDNEGIGSSFSTRIKLGAEGGSILGIGRTSGLLDFEPDEFSLNVYNTDDLNNIYGYSHGNIRFESENIYYTNQYFTYENGAVIIDQEGKTAMRAEPHFNVNYDSVANKTTLDTTLIQLIGSPGGIAGTDYHTINSKLVQSIGKSNVLYWTVSKGFTYGQNITFNLTTKYGPLWKNFFESKLENLPGPIRNTTTTITMTERTDPTTDENIYTVVLEIDRINVLDCKKGIIEISII
jgi:hypothetical protein